MSQPNINDEREIRIAKLQALQESDIQPFPSATERTHMVADALEAVENTPVTIAGRIMTKREMGKLCFCHVQDETGSMQIVLKKDEVGDDEFKLFVKKIDNGDIIEVRGTRFKTQKGEESVLVGNWTLLTKALRPLPDKFHGLQDEELRLRKRYLELITNPELRERFERKAKFWQATRDFLNKEGFLEVETPTLETTPGGADANPFITHHNALDMDVYLRISMGELWQKRLMVGGFDKTFEIGRQFRNEGMSREHLQDYSQMEFYWGYANYENSMELVERMYKHVIKEAFGTLSFDIGEFKDINLDTKWERIDYVDTIKEMTGLDVLAASEDELKDKLKEVGQRYDETDAKGRLIDSLWKFCRKKVKGPVFLVHHPVLVSPLAKRRKENPETTERYQVLIAGSELGNGYSELNDPIDQAQRFEAQAAMREAGDDEAQMHDQEFVEALEHGMPPTSGFGFSERLFSFFENQPIRECVLFPLVRPEGHSVSESGKAKNTMVAHAVILNGSDKELWTKMNTIAHLNASFGAREGKRLIELDKTQTNDGESIPMNIQHAIMIKETNDGKTLLELKQKADAQELHVECFTQAMQDTTDDNKVKEAHSKADRESLEILGVLVYGKKKVVEKLTKDFVLLK